MGRWIRTHFTRPIYLQKHLFKFGYPFTAKENIGLGQEYKKDYAQSQKLHYEELIQGIHRPPNKLSDMKDIFRV